MSNFVYFQGAWGKEAVLRGQSSRNTWTIQTGVSHLWIRCIIIAVHALKSVVTKWLARNVQPVRRPVAGCEKEVAGLPYLEKQKKLYHCCEVTSISDTGSHVLAWEVYLSVWHYRYQMLSLMHCLLTERRDHLSMSQFVILYMHYSMQTYVTFFFTLKSVSLKTDRQT